MPGFPRPWSLLRPSPAGLAEGAGYGLSGSLEPGRQCAARKMIPRGGGSIINITSVYGLVAAPGRAAYCASKAACNMLTKVLAIEWAREYWVNAIAPGYFRTELVQGIIESGMLPLGAIEKRTPLGRIEGCRSFSVWPSI